MAKFTGKPSRDYRTRSEPWQSWGWTARYVVMRFTQAVPAALLMLLPAFLRR
jgi:hypothetical protein